MFSAGHNKQSWQTDVILEDDVCKKKWQLLVQIFQEFSNQQEEGKKASGNVSKGLGSAIARRVSKDTILEEGTAFGAKAKDI